MAGVKRECVCNRLFDDRFYVYLPFHATVDAKDLHHRGVAGHHDKSNLNKFLNDEVLVAASIVHIAEKMAEGAYVRLYNIADASTMFDLIVQHLENWLWIGRNKGAYTLPPIEDLIALDDLAGYLYKFASASKEDDDPKYGFFDFFGIGYSISLVDNKQDVAKQKKKQKFYNPYTEDFIELIGAPV